MCPKRITPQANQILQEFKEVNGILTDKKGLTELAKSYIAYRDWARKLSSQNELLKLKLKENVGQKK